MDDFSKHIANLPPEKLALLESRLQKRIGGGRRAAAIARRGEPNFAPLSFAQQRLWFYDQLEPGNPVYNVSASVRLTGRLDVPSLERTLSEIVRRHEILRTTFPMIAGKPVQRIEPPHDFALPVTDLSRLAADARDAEVNNLIAQEARRPFDLIRGPLFRALLMRLGEEEHVALLTHHHIIYDGWSAGVFFKELGALYEAFLAGRTSPLPELPIQYADFAVWQREWLQGEALEERLSFWRRSLSGKLPVMKLPESRPRPARQTFRGAPYFATIEKSLTESLNDLSRREDVTLFMTLLAAFKTLLYRYSGQADIIVGSSVANRNRAEVEPLIGFFVNMLALRTSLAGNPSFRELLRRVREVTLNAYTHQDLPFEKVVEAIQPARDPSRTPIFQVMFGFQNTPMPPLELPGLRLELIEFDHGVARYDLTLLVWESDQGLRSSWIYNSDVLDAATVARMSRHLEGLLGNIVAQPGARLNELEFLSEDEKKGRFGNAPGEAAASGPLAFEMAISPGLRAKLDEVAETHGAVGNSDAPIAELEIVSDAERRRLVVEFNQTEADYPKDRCVHELFEAQVEKAPLALALEFESESLTYDELNARANRLAHHLRELGVGPDARVAICAERSVEMVVALLATLKAGGAYVPLDPDYPSERLAYMLEDSAPVVLLTRGAARDALAWRSVAVPVIDLDRDSAHWSAQSAENPQRSGIGLKERNLSYVIYTSGSTGRPKGAMNEHRGVVNRLFWMQEAYRLGANDAVLQKTPFSFDVSVWEFFWPLMSGARLVMARPGGHKDPAYLAKIIQERKITTIHFVPSMLQVFLEYERAQECRNLARVICSGEALPRALAKLFYEKLPETELYNLYGPTEAAVDVTAWNCKQEAGGIGVPIGRPIANTQIYILDAHGRPAPVGVAGEIYIGGAQVGRGYLNRPELTEERFAPNPFSREPGARMYKTGDLGRWLANGAIEFLGRTDFQVKIRGFRIELGEIEAMLTSYPGVREAVALARENGAGDQRLAVYYTGEKLGAETLRRHLSSGLPEYMVPSSYTHLESLPLNPNGKLDRQALRVIETATAERNTMFVGPRTPVEEILAAIWRQVLKLDQVGVNDNFFDLGGHSLLATQVLYMAREAFHVEPALYSLFESPTIAGLAKIIEAAVRAGDLPDLSGVTPVERGRPLPLSYAQQRLWFLDQLEPGNAFYNIFAPARLKGKLDLRALERTLTEIVRRHEALRTTFPAVEGRPVQMIAEAQPLSLPVADLSHLPPERREAEARRMAEEEAQQPFDLARGPLLRARLLRLDEDEHLALLTLHHIISDGWSAGILTREVAALYEAFAAGRPSPLAELPIQYADFAVWQRQWLQGAALDTQLAYWKRKLGGALPALQLPTDRPRPAVQRFRGARESLRLGSVLSKSLKEFSRQECVTLFMVLLAAFKALLHRYTGQDDIIIGSPIANRNRIEIEGLIGFFVNTLALRTDLSGDPSFRELVSRARQVALEASAHQDLPFEKLVDELQLARDLSRTPLFQTLFVFQNAPGQALELPGLTLTPMEIEGETAKFDLTLSVSETDQELIAKAEYNTDLFEGATISRMLAHFQNLLEGAARHPAQRLSELPLLTDAERRQLLEWNKPGASYKAETCLHQLFEAQAARTPNALAVTFEGERLSYQRLNARANQLAHRLRALGVGPDVLVGLCLERSLDLVVAILAVLKAGGAYLPLDPTYPKDRLAFMLDDSRAPVLLTERRLLEQLPERRARANCPHVICIDSEWELIERESAENPANLATADNLAYVIYTSGSTGRPKGALVSHANVVRLFSATQDWYHFDELDVWTLFHSYAFDFSVWELWGALLYGGRLAVIPYWVSRSPEAFHELLRRERVTVLNQTPSAFRQLIRAEEQAETTPELALRLVIFGGEALDLQSLKPWFDRRGDERPQLVNMYGITETTVHVSYRPIRADDLEEGKGSVIGGAIPDLRVYALDANLRPTPIGVSGEMYVGGAGVTRGYLDRPELSAERFIPDPYGAEPGARLYRTGDLARYLADGDLEYLGRIDHQVKIRGFRIELGEIEAALTAHADIREAVVLAREDTPGEKRLVAYLVTAPGPAPSISELREFLKQKLPEHMAPAAFVTLDALPLTENGKLDRRALPAPDAARPDLEEAYVAPSNPREEKLAEIWASALGLERVGVHDNFFELGGDSILSIQIIARANQAGLRLTPKQVFQCQTIAELAAIAETAPAIEAEQCLVTGPAPLTPIQRWFFEQCLPDRNHWNQALLFETRRALNPALLEQAVARLLEHHDALRLRFTLEEAGWRQTIAGPDAATPFSVIELSGLSEEKRISALEAKAAELQAGLNLSEGPLLRAAYFDLGRRESGRLLIIIHHLAVDGVSWRILLEDLQTAYRQLSRGEEIALPPKTTSFKRWAEKLAEYGQSEVVRAAEKDYWLDVAGTKVAPLPVDFTGAANTEASSRSVSVSLSVEETKALLKEAPEAYHTQINDLLLTALGQAFVKWTGRQNMLIDLEGHGREDIFEDVDLSRTVGWFTTIYPALLNLEKVSDPGEGIKSVKEQLRSIPNRGLGYGLLRYLSEDEMIAAALRRLPQAEISFNYLGQLDQALPEDSPFAPALESAGPIHSPRGSRRHALDVIGSVAQGKLRLTWTYSENVHRHSTIERLSRNCIEALRSLIEHCASSGTKGYTPSDFPEAELSQEELNELLAQYGAATE